MLQAAAVLSVGALYKIGRSILPYIGPSYSISQQYVIINGCTDGIGKQFAHFLNRKQVPLVLIGRNQKKLNELQDQLNGGKKNEDKRLWNKHKAVCIDFSEASMKMGKYMEEIEKLRLGDHSVSGIINCCGAAFVKKYSQLTLQQIEATKQVNILPLEISLSSLNHRSISPNPFMLNISSYTSHFPLKYSSVYSATKSYNSNLLKAYALQNSHVRVLSVQPWYVTTKMTGFRKGWDCVTPGQVAQGAMKALGKKWIKVCTGSIKHELMYEFGYPLQKWYFPRVIQENYERMMKLNQLRKKRTENKTKQNESK